MNDDDDWMDRLLRANRASPVEDGVFTDSLMMRVRSGHAGSPRWIVPASTAAGAILAAGVSLSDGLLPVARSLVSGQNIGIAALLPLFLMWAACAWVLSETK